jgi:putative two-component system response regulator
MTRKGRLLEMSELKTIFVVDDNVTNLAVAKKELEKDYRVFTIDSAMKMFNLLDKVRPDLILLDVEMPQINGYEAMIRLKAEKDFNIPVIFLTARSDAETELIGFQLGAVDFVTKPFSAPVLLRHIELHLNMDALIKRSTEQLRKTQNAIISVVADLVENRDKVTGHHIERTQIYVDILIRALLERGVYSDVISTWNLDTVIPASQLHDVGKITITDLILNKPGKLTPEEYDIMKTHAAEGERIIDEIINKTGDDSYLAHAKIIAGTHHEKWDGSGYPNGLKGHDIPIQGRIMAIADVYDALRSARPYKKIFSVEESVEIIANDSGTAFDPAMVNVFLEIAPSLERTK